MNHSRHHDSHSHRQADRPHRSSAYNLGETAHGHGELGKGFSSDGNLLHQIPTPGARGTTGTSQKQDPHNNATRCSSQGAEAGSPSAQTTAGRGGGIPMQQDQVAYNSHSWENSVCPLVFSL